MAIPVVVKNSNSFLQIIISVGAVMAEIQTSSHTPQTHEQPVTITFTQDCNIISTTLIPLLPPPPPVPTPRLSQTTGMYMKQQIFATFHV
jgi:hypothetical protein